MIRDWSIHIGGTLLIGISFAFIFPSVGYWWLLIMGIMVLLTSGLLRYLIMKSLMRVYILRYLPRDYPKLIDGLTNQRILRPFSGGHTFRHDYLRQSFLSNSTIQIDILINDFADGEKRAKTLEKIMQFRTWALEPLIARLDDKNWVIKRAVTEALVRLGDKSAVVPLIAHLNDNDRLVRLAVAEALGKLGDERAVEPLIAYLYDEESAIREAVETALVSLGHLSVDSLIARLNQLDIKTEDYDESRYYRLISTLGKIGDKRAAEPLINLLSHKKDYIGLKAIKALGDIGDEKAITPIITWVNNHKDYIFNNSLYNSSRREIMESLAKMGQASIDPLIACLYYDETDVDQMLWLGALEAIGDPAVKPLIARLKDENKLFRSRVIKVLRAIKNPQAVKPLLPYLNDENKSVRYETARALGQLGDISTVAPLISHLSDADKDIRLAVADALGELGDERAVEPLIACLSDKYSWVRYYVAEALGKLGNKRAVEPLIACLNDEDESVRHHVAEALGKLGDKRVVDPLIDCLNDKSSNVRRAIAEALGKIGDVRAVDPLIPYLDDNDGDVHRAVAKALGELRDARSINPLIANLATNNAVKDALIKIGKESVKPLIACLLRIQKNEEDTYAYYLAEETLIKIRNDAIESLIAHLLKLDKDDNYTQYTLLSIIREIGTPEALQALRDAGFEE